MKEPQFFYLNTGEPRVGGVTTTANFLLNKAAAATHDGRQ